MAGVLIVEDEIFVALDIEHVLVSAGIEITGLAHDRKSAMALVGDCDVALIDVNLHDGATGPSIGMDIAALHGVKVIFVTSHPFQIGEAEEIAFGVITKPFRPDMIVDMVKSALTGDAAFLPIPASLADQLQS